MPPVVHNGRIRFTEQGEVISFRYGLPGIARRHLEQIVNAVIRATDRTPDSEAPYGTTEPGAPDLLDGLARSAMAGYRALIEEPGLWPWYVAVTPVEQISRLPIASRPVSRKAATQVDFEGLRAIPWVFAWTQTRYLVPGWYGSGRGLREAIDRVGPEPLRRLYRDWPFFRAVVDSVQREMSRARLEIARCYARLAEGDSGGTDFHAVIEEDYGAARAAILAVTGADELLDHAPVIRKSIRLRNPYTDVLNLLQIELLTRYRDAPETEGDELRQALFLSINGIAAAMQSTG
jgi:phosphoenolpyruvate carboxylase